MNRTDQLWTAGVGHVGNLKRCLHIPLINASNISLTHYLDYYPRHEIIFTAAECMIRKKWRRPTAENPNPNADRFVTAFPHTNNNV